jgi:transmembrane sensor
VLSKLTYSLKPGKMSRESLHLLLDRYLKNQCSDEERIVVERLYGMLDKDEAEIIPLNEINTLEQKLWDRINHQIYLKEEDLQVPSSNKKSIRFRNTWIAAAAAIAVILAISYLFIKDFKNSDYIKFKALPNLTERINNTSHPVQVRLEDGSLVVLQPKSSLSFPKHFASSSREVSLKGEGFFLISKNKHKPFFVYNDKVITRVVGTSFIIKSHLLTDEVEVIVKTGKVMVFSNKNTNLNIKSFLEKKDQVTLTPNQQTTYKEDFETRLVADPIPLIIESYSFEDASLIKVVQQLSKTYGIKISITDQDLNEDSFTGDLSGLGLYKKLDMICQSVNAQYKISGTQITINKK